MRKNLQFFNKNKFFLVLLMFLFQLGHAQLLTENFSYSTAGDITTASGGNWTAHSGSTFYPQFTTSGLTYPGYPGSGVGGAVTISTTGVADVNRTYTAQTSGNVYAAFLVNVSSATTTGDYFIHLGTGASSFVGRFFVKRDASNNLAFGISKNAAVASATFTGFTYSLNTTYLVVIKYSIISGTTNDTVSVFINPALNGTEGTANITAPDPTAADVNPSAFYIRQGTPPGATIDGIRIATSWASAVPSAASISSSTTSLLAYSTTYGVATPSQTSLISGSGLSANITATAPTGFEVSSDNTTFGTTATFTQSGGTANGTLYIRMSATATVGGSYNNQNIVLSSTGATAVNITTAASGNSVSKATLTATAGNQAVAQGTAVATVTGAGTYSLSGFFNGDTSSVVSGTVSYTTNYTDTTPAATAGITITPDVSGLTAANYNFAAANGTITITSSPVPTISSALTATATYGTSYTYQIVADNSPTSYNATNLPAGLSINTATGEISGIPTAAPGVYNIGLVATNAGGDGTATLSLTINAKSLTISGIATVDKIYDATTSVSYTGGSLEGVYGSDTVSFTGSATMVDKVIGSNKPVTFALTLNGAQAGNYSLTQPSGLTVNITAKELTVTGAAAQNKTFDGNTNAVITGTLSGIAGSDVVTLSGTGTFASSAIGNNIAVTSTSTIGGADAGNYYLTQPTGLTANISPAIVALLQWNTFGNAGTETTEPSTSNEANIGSASLNYTGSTVTPASNGNRLGGTNWTVGATIDTSKYIQFTVTPNAGFTFTPTSFEFIWDFSGSGPSSVALRSSVDGYASNIGAVTGLTANTSAVRTIAISGLSAISTPTTFRIYGYQATALTGTGGFDCAVSTNNVVLKGYTGVAPAPSFSTSGSPAALSTTYGTASTETSFTVSGTYLLSGVTATAPAGFEVSATSGSGFGSTATVGAAGNITNVPVYVRLAANASVAGSPYSGDIVLSTTGATSVNVATASSTVTPKTLTINGISIANKVVDGNTDATITGTPSLVGVVTGDEANVILGGTPVATFTSSAVATDIPVTVSGYTITGSASSNYSLTQPSGLVADITSEPSPVISSALTATVTYGTAFNYFITATNAPSSYNATNLPAGLTVNTTTGEISGVLTAAPGNYSIILEATNVGGTGSDVLVLTVEAKVLTVDGLSIVNKIYDGNTSATYTGGTLNGIYNTDVVSFTGVATFGTKTVGTAKPVSLTLTLNGAAAGNYTVTQLTGLTADITAKTLTITGAAAQNKPFDGTTAAVITGTLSGVVSGDVVTLNGTGTFATSAQGTGIAVTSTSTLGGADAGNYSLTQPTGLTANITQPAILMWNTFSNAGTETTEPSVYNNNFVSSSNITVAGITTAGNANRLGGSNWPLTTTIDATKYYQFTVTPNAGYQFTPTSLSFVWDRSGTGPSSIAIRSSINNYATDIAVLNGVTASTSAFNSLVMSSLGDVQSATTFRVYAYNATGAAGTGGFDTATNVNNIILYGTTSLITGSTAATMNGTTSICSGDSAVINVAITGGRSPYTLVYTDGTNNYTESNYVSGSSIVVTPASTTTYSIVSITDANSLVGTGNTGSAVITLLSNTTYYADTDNDGYGNPASSIVSCLPLVGYVANDLDCNDASNTIYPGAVDVCYDGIDNDCNGNIDNIGLPGGCIPIYTTPAVTVPNSTISYGASIITSLVANCQGYRYVVTRVNPADDTPMSAPVTVDMGMRNLFLSNLSNYAYGAKFKIETTVRINNVWQPNYAPAFYVFTPTPLSTVASCGTQISNLTTQVTSSPVALVSVYRYQVQRLDASNNVVSTQVITSGLRYFSFEQVTDFRYDANYSVSCAIRNLDGVFMAYGPACTVQAPKHPTSEVRATQCNDYQVLNNNEFIYANLVRNAVLYRYRLYNIDQGYDYSVDRNANFFRLSDFPGLVPGETYSVQVAVSMPGQPDFGPFGKTCTIIAPTAARTIEDTQAAEAISFEATVYPNPFAENFYFKVNSASTADYTIQVYDMLGKMVESKTVSSDSVESTEVGANFPAGVYNVILTQGENIKTLRVIKR
ncbi:YDG domain-containing protein [Flavobacterium sp. N1719]|uniref:YDG domain-containing protein n=1 Tax=Flavobacterium sp. N1719 TaxID=2885633 RepID=UPI0022215AAB|nr:YDG domain-containing protein [Flavobacterium sp. N1719]